MVDWKKGDLNYGEDFIELHRPCYVVSPPASCECVADFTVISSTKDSKKFADHITSFEHGRLPVIYRVRYEYRGSFASARLVKVGDWRVIVCIPTTAFSACE